MSPQRTLLGAERLLEEAFELIAGRKVGLITNHSGVDGQLRATADRLHREAGVELAALFGPEHGIRGDAADGEKVEGSRDRRTGVVAHSLYGQTRQPTPEMLEEVEVMLFDIQDVGARFYTYLYTMSLAMEACAGRGIPFVVLDRPNPLGGAVLEGNILDPAFASFVGKYPIPIRYGMSVGEVARFFNGEYGIGAALQVVELRGWQVAAGWEATGLPWVPPSPNMPAVETAQVYPGMCFFEGTNVSEGRGTPKPFEQVGAPYIEGPLLADQLNALELPGALFRPVYFQPAAAKYAGQVCRGVQIHVVDRRVFRPVRAGLEAVATVRRLWPAEFAWRVPQGGIHNFDRLAGTDQLRLALDQGASVAELEADWEEGLRSFRRQCAPYLLYGRG
jgi:beta-N-acetylhexosaminidase